MLRSGCAPRAADLAAEKPPLGLRSQATLAFAERYTAGRAATLRTPKPYRSLSTATEASGWNAGLAGQLNPGGKAAEAMDRH